MFKRKPDIPPRPKVPTIEQIIEDIDHSSADDNIFVKSCNGGERRELTGQRNESEAVYNKVRNFVEVNATLKEMLQKLHDQNEALKISDLELKAMAEDIRKQALEALQ